MRNAALIWRHRSSVGRNPFHSRFTVLAANLGSLGGPFTSTVGPKTAPPSASVPNDYHTTRKAGNEEKFAELASSIDVSFQAVSRRALDRNSPTSAPQSSLRKSIIGNEHHPIRGRMPAAGAFRQGQGFFQSLAQFEFEPIEGHL
jgi:hypothetical protein